MSQREGGAERVRKAVDGSEEVMAEAPRPLMRQLPPADPFPVRALDDVLASAAHAIHDRVQAPLAMCAQSVLAVATLATQGHADVELPTSQSRPLSSYYLDVGVSGERKSAVDTEALWPVRKREATLREKHGSEQPDYANAQAAWEKAREVAKRHGKGDRARIKAALDALGPGPDAPLLPLLTCTEPTYEGLTKAYAIGWPSLGLFSDEGGQFIGGHGMTDDAQLRTATGLSRLWDGRAIDRVRGGEGVMVLPGRRLSMHLMAQPEVAALFLGNSLLAEQGLLSRVLATAPESAIGLRLWHESSAESVPAMKRYGARLLDILETPLPLAEGKRNELSPRTVPLSEAARRLWIGFYNHIECRLRTGGELEPVRGLANKLPEHAARLGAVLALVRDIQAHEVTDVEIESGIALAQHYAAEALRLFAASRVSADVQLARGLLNWLWARWKSQSAVSLPDIYQYGPNTIREKATATRIVGVLEDHGYLVRIKGGAEIDGKWRSEVWRIIRGH